uniref:Uncharacterized protein n=1 Tax=Opuntia streptacantha TaxID=393608 RepID=A0A7C9CT95_OPUST
MKKLPIPKRSLHFLSLLLVHPPMAAFSLRPNRLFQFVGFWFSLLCFSSLSPPSNPRPPCTTTTTAFTAAVSAKVPLLSAAPSQFRASFRLNRRVVEVISPRLCRAWGCFSGEVAKP